MKDPEFIQLITDASMGDGDAIMRLRNLVNWGETIEKAFFEVRMDNYNTTAASVRAANPWPYVRKPLRLVKD